MRRSQSIFCLVFPISVKPGYDCTTYFCWRGWGRNLIWIKNISVPFWKPLPYLTTCMFLSLCPSHLCQFWPLSLFNPNLSTPCSASPVWNAAVCDSYRYRHPVPAVLALHPVSPLDSSQQFHIEYVYFWNGFLIIVILLYQHTTVSSTAHCQTRYWIFCGWCKSDLLIGSNIIKSDVHFCLLLLHNLSLGAKYS